MTEPENPPKNDYQQLSNDLGQYVPPQWVKDIPAKKDESELEKKVTTQNDK